MDTVLVSSHRIKGAHERDDFPVDAARALLAELCLLGVCCKVTLSSASSLFPLEGSHCIRLTSNGWGYVAHYLEFCTGDLSLFIVYLLIPFIVWLIILYYIFSAKNF